MASRGKVAPTGYDRENGGRERVPPPSLPLDRAWAATGIASRAPRRRGGNRFLHLIRPAAGCLIFPGDAGPCRRPAGVSRGSLAPTKPTGNRFLRLIRCRFSRGSRHVSHGLRRVGRSGSRALNVIQVFAVRLRGRQGFRNPCENWFAIRVRIQPLPPSRSAIRVRTYIRPAAGCLVFPGGAGGLVGGRQVQ